MSETLTGEVTLSEDTTVTASPGISAGSSASTDIKTDHNIELTGSTGISVGENGSLTVSANQIKIDGSTGLRLNGDSKTEINANLLEINTTSNGIEFAYGVDQDTTINADVVITGEDADFGLHGDSSGSSDDRRSFAVKSFVVKDFSGNGAVQSWRVNYYIPTIEIKDSYFHDDYGSAFMTVQGDVRGDKTLDRVGSITATNLDVADSSYFNTLYFQEGEINFNEIEVTDIRKSDNKGLLSGLVIDAETEFNVNNVTLTNIHGSGQSVDSYGMQAMSNSSSKYGNTNADIRLLKIENVKSDYANAFGLYTQDCTGSSEKEGKLSFKADQIDVSSVEGRAYSIGVWNANGTTLISNNIDIKDVTGISAYGYENDYSNTLADNVEINGVSGNEAVGFFNLQGNVEIDDLTVSGVVSCGSGNAILLDNAGGDTTVKKSAFLTHALLENGSSYEFSYKGAYKEEADTQERDVREIAIRSIMGGKTYLNNENGEYRIAGTVLAGRGTSDNSIEGGSISLGGKTLQIYGDVYAGNGGKVDITLNSQSLLEGQVDDYHELSSDLAAVNVFKNPVFSDAQTREELPVSEAGHVTLNLNGGRWIAHGQSFISKVSLNGGTIYLTNNSNSGPSSVTAGTLSGVGTVWMKLDAKDKGNGDMLYATLGADEDSEIEVQVKWDENGGYDALEAGEKVRFATLNNAAASRITARTDGAGIFNLKYRVITDAYDADNTVENTMYNGADDGAGIYKPGADYTDAVFDANGTNYYIVKTESSEPSGPDDEPILPPVEELSKAGQTIVAMSKANYANAVYMDTLNKRQGEARYSMGRDNGVWVRMRHDNIGKEDAFRSHNTMFEMGYDVKDANSYGEFHTGVALDYLNGSIDYHNVNGDGDLQRYGLWFYTTFLGNEGQYADLVLKYGHLKNDFDVTSELNEKISGNYSNDVVSLSAETGWKFTHDTGFYIEPQLQLQYSYVTSADYSTSQHTQVELDSIHSLIGRAGFRVGKDFAAENPITAYIRGDVLHEFLGDQDIRAHDNTGVFDATYENDDTWYSAGVGLSVMTSQNTYFYIEGEQVFGADNDNTYTVSGGFKHSF
ncbi:autotransporter outer membrane beta-barrel domain-containing protein [uncultured Succinatimonas sp.]|uniref:autotransporter outer membrane beta-barrel domain-containing protein n=1 Tax=uncultured Succinatimonas sp. TaxID=1262973 RepID=UPI0025D0BE3C|nr:autotransporter outer membrane beta-barrel domain-containing protein [uncultured Succinatimonas sp.]